ALIDALVAGDEPTPLERHASADPLVGDGPRQATHRSNGAVALVASRQRGDLRLSPEYVTWELAVLRVVSPRRTFFLRVPRSAAQRLDRLWVSGALDAPLSAYATRPAGAAVATLDEPNAGLFDTAEEPAAAMRRMEPGKQPPGGKRKRKPLPPPVFAPPPVPPPPPVFAPPPVPPLVALTPRPRWPWLLVGLVIVITIVVLWRGFPGGPGPLRSPEPLPSAIALVTPSPDCPPGLAGGPDCPNPNASPSGPLSASPCPVGVPCGSASPLPSSGSPGPTPCLPGTVCVTPTPSVGPTPSVTPTPSARPTRTPAPTRPPDRTGPSISRLAWAPGTIGVPTFAATCDPTSGLGQTVALSVLVSDPSGVAKVVLHYQRADDAAPVNVTMTLSSGRYRVTLSTANGTAAWQPQIGYPSYTVRLSVTATDSKGNLRTSPTQAGFTVRTC
ncbi:MAG: hypothetical protein ACRDGQ_06630, partial [Candidatus Limnocylindrales bacterium]